MISTQYMKSLRAISYLLSNCIGQAKSAGMNEEHVVNLLRIANSIDNDSNNNLPAVEHRYEGLKQEVNSLENKKTKFK